MNNKLFVGNLDFAVSESELKSAFEPHGEIVSASIVQDRDTGNSRGFAFVEYASGNDAERAIGALDGSEFHGRNLSVNVARQRNDRQGRRNRA
jgi:RNA recognition motif-containing protein